MSPPPGHRVTIKINFGDANMRGRRLVPRDLTGA